MPEITGIATEDTTGTVYSVEDDDGTSYVYRGSPTDNWVSFGGYYWRIIRVNGDGSLRMIYNGTSTAIIGDTTQIGKSAYNSTDDDNAYVGFMYGQTGASTYAATHTNTNKSNVMSELESWYTSSGLSNYAENIDTNAGFCNDRQTTTGTWTNYNTGLGYGKNATTYAPLGRLYENNASKTIQTPSLKCGDAIRDLFTSSSSSKGNKHLTYPIGLITSDEVVYAGFFFGTANTSNYLYTNKHYWTMSPSYFNGTGTIMFIVASNGFLSNSYRASGQLYIRPVINLRSDVTLTGSGLSTDPYRIAEI